MREWIRAQSEREKEVRLLKSDGEKFTLLGVFPGVMAAKDACEEYEPALSWSGPSDDFQTWGARGVNGIHYYVTTHKLTLEGA